MGAKAVIAIPEADRAAAAVLGRALKVLRTRAGFSLLEAGERAGITSQGWGKYESGSAPGIFRPSVQRRLSEALGFSAAALVEECARVEAAAP